MKLPYKFESVREIAIHELLCDSESLESNKAPKNEAEYTSDIKYSK
jgi:hypothetical protein